MAESTNNKEIPLLKLQPFGKNALEQVIAEVGGNWVSTGLKVFKSLWENSDQAKISSQSGISKLLAELSTILPPSFQIAMEEGFLSNRLNSYSAEFGFAFALICRRLTGPSHTKLTTERAPLVKPSEFMPLDFLELLGARLISEGLLGGKLLFKSLAPQEAAIQIVYPSVLARMPGWRDIAYDQQETHLLRTLNVFWGLSQIQYQLKTHYDLANGQYIFEYDLAWKGGETSQGRAGFLAAVGASKGISDYLAQKTVVWFDYMNSIRDVFVADSRNALKQAITLRSKAMREYNASKGQVDELINRLTVLEEINRELENNLLALQEIDETASISDKANKIANEKLRKLTEDMFRLKERLLNVVSHELRTPLSSLLGFTELMIEGEFGPDESKDFLNTIYQESVRMRDFLDQFWNMQRLESGKMELKREPLVVLELVEEAVAGFKGYAEGVTLKYKIPEGLPAVLADKGALLQVFRHLLSNAIKYSPSGGEIVLAADHEQGLFVFSVSDRGLGIPEGEQGRIFEPFYRISRPEEEGLVAGTGLGLAICRETIGAHGGEIWLESELGKGSSFFFTIPQVS